MGSRRSPRAVTWYKAPANSSLNGLALRLVYHGYATMLDLTPVPAALVAARLVSSLLPLDLHGSEDPVKVSCLVEPPQQV